MMIFVGTVYHSCGSKSAVCKAQLKCMTITPNQPKKKIYLATEFDSCQILTNYYWKSQCSIFLLLFCPHFVRFHIIE